ncbi:hypothetical protein DPMN_149056 [Dreissena polymorpha]|uniref:Uncharacterized protein n=1 Tax=Dreissena polymorpha TaxID=45954 RepID=A0A9D4J0T2_DREPO|nr:hypothetical protein DPMN_149056 [Dreissena polymorpha]
MTPDNPIRGNPRICRKITPLKKEGTLLFFRPPWHLYAPQRPHTTLGEGVCSP